MLGSQGAELSHIISAPLSTKHAGVQAETAVPSRYELDHSKKEEEEWVYLLENFRIPLLPRSLNSAWKTCTANTIVANDSAQVSQGEWSFWQMNVSGAYLDNAYTLCPSFCTSKPMVDVSPECNAKF